MKSSEIVRETKNVLFSRGWHQGGYEGPDGSVCLRGAVRVAVLGDLRSVTDEEIAGGSYHSIDRAEDCIRRLLPDWNLAGWNDTPGRTFGEVIDVLDLAEKRAMIAEEGE
jgi:hypothetical protein